MRGNGPKPACCIPPLLLQKCLQNLKYIIKLGAFSAVRTCLRYIVKEDTSALTMKIKFSEVMKNISVGSEPLSYHSCRMHDFKLDDLRFTPQSIYSERLRISLEEKQFHGFQFYISSSSPSTHIISFENSNPSLVYNVFRGCIYSLMCKILSADIIYVLELSANDFAYRHQSAKKNPRKLDNLPVKAVPFAYFSSSTKLLSAFLIVDATFIKILWLKKKCSAGNVPSQQVKKKLLKVIFSQCHSLCSFHTNVVCSCIISMLVV